MPFGLGCTVYPTVAAPWPLAALNVIHESLALDDHAHSRAVSSVSVPLPPAAGISLELLLIETPHLTGVGPLTVVVADPPQAAIKRMRRAGQKALKRR